MRKGLFVVVMFGEGVDSSDTLLSKPSGLGKWGACSPCVNELICQFKEFFSKGKAKGVVASDVLLEWGLLPRHSSCELIK